MRDIRHVTPSGIVVHGVRYDHPALQDYRVQAEEALGGAGILVRCEVLEHTAVAEDGTRYRVDLCHVRTLRGRLICFARPIPEAADERALVASLAIA